MTMNEPVAWTLAYTETDSVHCNGENNGVVTLTAAGGNIAEGAYTYTMDNFVTTQAENVFNGLAAGDYTFNGRDARGCEQ